MQQASDVSPRKTPRQGRSKATVEALLQATARVLVEDGYAKTTTNRIAKVAGVSIGSLYQYFPNKQALLAALVDRHHEEMTALFLSKLGEVHDGDLENGTRTVIRALVEAHRNDPLDAPLHRVIFYELSRIGLARRIRAFEELAVQAVQGMLERFIDDIRPDNTSLAAFVLVHSVEAVVVAAILRNEELLADESLVTEISELVLGYLRP